MTFCGRGSRGSRSGWAARTCSWSPAARRAKCGKKSIIYWPGPPVAADRMSRARRMQHHREGWLELWRSKTRSSKRKCVRIGQRYRERTGDVGALEHTQTNVCKRDKSKCSFVRLTEVDNPSASFTVTHEMVSLWDQISTNYTKKRYSTLRLHAGCLMTDPLGRSNLNF